jgi:very-short-patch-repair endonuclease
MNPQRPLSRRAAARRVDPSSGASRHLPPQGGKGNEAAESPLPSPLAGEGVGARSATTDEGPSRQLVRHLRKNPTDAERRLWSALRDRRFENYKFRRQVPIGRYIADFACFERKLIVEVDGGQHSESEHDRGRDAWLGSQGLRVLRFWNVDVFQALDGTLLAIHDALKQVTHD